MNYKYFGNSLDLFKYDLLTELVSKDGRGLFYVPMVTTPEHRVDDPKYHTYELGEENILLKEFLSEIHQNDKTIEISAIHQYFENINLPYKTYKPYGYLYFDDEVRETYLSGALRKYSSKDENQLLFFDPDVGLDLGISRRTRSFRQRYLMINELRPFHSNLKDGDFIGCFQHLGNTLYKPEDRVTDLKKEFGDWVLMVGYTRIQGGLFFIFKTESDYHRIRKRIEEYLDRYKYLKHSNRIILI